MTIKYSEVTRTSHSKRAGADVLTAAADAKGPATQLYEAGFKPLIPVIPPDAEMSPNSKVHPKMRGKVPGKLGKHGWYGFKGWQQHQASSRDVRKWDKWGANVGINAEHYPAVDIDVDDRELANALGILTYEVLGRAPVRKSRPPRSLLMYRTKEPFTKRVLLIQYKGAKHKVEVLGQGQQYLVAGTHPSGKKYRWAGKKGIGKSSKLTLIDGGMITDLFAALSRKVEEMGGTVVRAQKERQDYGPQEELAAPSLEALRKAVERIPNGARFASRDSYIAMGAAIKAAGGDKAFLIFADWAARWEGGTNDPEVVEGDWHGLHPPFQIGWDWIESQSRPDPQEEFSVDPKASPPKAWLDPRERALYELNEEYAIVQRGSKVHILQEREGQEPVFLQEKAFKLLLKNEYVPSLKERGKVITLAHAWMSWSKRREYRRVVFKPGERNVPGCEYNLWRGWARDPSPKGTCDKFLDHLRDVVCDRDDGLYEWLLDWMAHLFQCPMEKPGVVVALQGSQGAGKSIVGAILKKLLGRHQVVVDKAEYVTGRFNSHLEICLLLQAEEAFWGGNKKAESTLKHLVTGETLRIEWKFGDSVEMDNYTRLLITSNEEWVWPAAIDDRRLAMIRVSDKRVRDREHFRAIFAELEEGGYEKLLDTLLTRKIDRERVRVAPRTAALEAQVAESMSPAEQWLRNLLETGQIPGTVEPDGSARVSCAALYDEYLEMLPPRAYPKKEQAFGYFLKNHLRAEKVGREQVRTRRRMGGVKSTVYRVPPLPALRAAYTARGRGAPTEWDEPDGWIGSREEPDFEAASSFDDGDASRKE